MVWLALYRPASYILHLVVTKLWLLSFSKLLSLSNKKELLQTDELAQIKEMIETFKDAAVEIKEDEDGEIVVKTNTIE